MIPGHGRMSKLNDVEEELNSSNIENVTKIDECVYLDDEEASRFISKEMNEKTLNKFLQHERDFYTKAFPMHTLQRKLKR